ncbi:MAG TPA: YdcF family protein [Phycisphaerae bacterium]|nr:YdcF family protein [Phycisphaerae bacterium]
MRTKPDSITNAIKNAPTRCGAAYRFLDNFIFISATASVLTGQTWRWMSLDFAGQITAAALPIVWLVSLICLALNRRVGRTPAGGMEEEKLRRKLRINRLLLIPSWLVLLVLAMNTADYFRLWKMVDGDLPFWMPMCLPVMLVLAAWLLGRPDQLLAGPAGKPATEALPLGCRWRAGRALDAVLIAPAALLVIWVFFFEYRADPPPKNTTVDVAVVLGNLVLPNDTCGFIMRNRVLAAIELYKQKRVRYIIVSGNAPNGIDNLENNSTLAMAALCLSNGIPADKLILDFHGDNTRFSAENAVRIMRENHWTSVVGVSSDYHLPRIALAFAQLGVHAWTVPAINGYWSQSDPKSMVREWIALPTYWLNTTYHRE